MNQYRVRFAWATVAALMIVQRPNAEAAPSNPSSYLDAVIANAAAAGDAKAERRATNLKVALTVLKPSDLRGIRCGKIRRACRAST